MARDVESGGAVTMSRAAFMREHKHLVKVLDSAEPKKLKAEAKKQGKELKGKH